MVMVGDIGGKEEEERHETHRLSSSFLVCCSIQSQLQEQGL